MSVDDLSGAQVDALRRLRDLPTDTYPDLRVSSRNRGRAVAHRTADALVARGYAEFIGRWSSNPRVRITDAGRAVLDDGG